MSLSRHCGQAHVPHLPRNPRSPRFIREFTGRPVYFCGRPSRRGARELMTKPRPLSVNNVALLVPLRSVQFSASGRRTNKKKRRLCSVQFSANRCDGVNYQTVTKLCPLTAQISCTFTHFVQFSSVQFISLYWVLSSRPLSHMLVKL